MSIDSNHKEVLVKWAGVGVDSRLQWGQEPVHIEGEIASVGDSLIKLDWERKERGNVGLRDRLFLPVARDLNMLINDVG